MTAPGPALAVPHSVPLLGTCTHVCTKDRTQLGYAQCLSLTLQLCLLLLGVDEIPGIPEEPCFSRIYLVSRSVNVLLPTCSRLSANLLQP